MNSIDEIMALIDWNSSEEEQKRGIAMAREVQCIRAFFQPATPGFSKSVWGNCAIIICEREDKELIPHIAEMLMWLQDINWPGAEQVLYRLLRFSDVHMLCMTITDMVPALVAIDENAWLSTIAILLGNEKIAAKLDKTTVRILESYLV